MTCAEHQKLIDTIDQHEVRFSVDCIQNVMQCCHIRLQDMQGVRVCYEVCKSHPDYLQIECPKPARESQAEWDFTNRDSVLMSYLGPSSLFVPELKIASKAVRPLNDGLASFTLKPPHLKGENLFRHMVKISKRTTAAREEAFGPSAYLDLDLQPDALKCIAPSEKDLTIGAIMASVGWSYIAAGLITPASNR
jgi:hypothetical protein